MWWGWWSHSGRGTRVFFILAAIIIAFAVFRISGWWFFFLFFPFFFNFGRGWGWWQHHENEKRKRDPETVLIMPTDDKPKRADSGRVALGDDGELIDLDEPPLKPDQQRQDPPRRPDEYDYV